MTSRPSPPEPPAPLGSRWDLALKALFALACCSALYLRLEIFLWLALWPLVGALAIAWGRLEERTGFIAILAALAVTRQVFGLQAPSPAMILVDAALLAVLAAIALRSDRWWPSWAAAFQLAAVVTRLMFFAPVRVIELYEYMVSLAIWSWLVLIALSFGVWDRVRDGGLRDRGAWRAWLGAGTFLGMTAFAFWYVWPALPARLAELAL